VTRSIVPSMRGLLERLKVMTTSSTVVTLAKTVEPLHHPGREVDDDAHGNQLRLLLRSRAGHCALTR
jgi:hypothetical protein